MKKVIFIKGVRLLVTRKNGSDHKMFRFDVDAFKHNWHFNVLIYRNAWDAGKRASLEYGPYLGIFNRAIVGHIGHWHYRFNLWNVL